MSGEKLARSGKNITAGDFTFEQEGWFGKRLWSWWTSKGDYETTALDMMKKHYEFYEQLNYVSGISVEDYVTREAYIKCSLGTKQIYLDTYEDHGVLDPNEKPLMTCEDCKVGENIYQFGTCKCENIYTEKLPHPSKIGEPDENGNERYHCFPVLSEKWKQKNGNLFIGDQKSSKFVEALMADAFLTCKYGGFISIVGIEVKEQEIEEVPESGNVITFSDIVHGKLNDEECNLMPNEHWYAYQYQGSGTVKVENGKYYKIAVGPKILDSKCSDASKLQLDDYGGQIYKRIDVELEKKPDYKTNNELEDHLILECVACGVKAHTYSIHPDKTKEHAHKIFEYNKDITASFDIENGLVQTGIAYPNSWNAQNDNESDGPIALAHMDGSVIEFWGDSVDFSPNEYKLVRIIVLDEDESEE